MRRTTATQAGEGSKVVIFAVTDDGKAPRMYSAEYPTSAMAKGMTELSVDHLNVAAVFLTGRSGKVPTPALLVAMMKDQERLEMEKALSKLRDADKPLKRTRLEMRRIQRVHDLEGEVAFLQKRRGSSPTKDPIEPDPKDPLAVMKAVHAQGGKRIEKV